MSLASHTQTLCSAVPFKKKYIIAKFRVQRHAQTRTITDTTQNLKGIPVFRLYPKLDYAATDYFGPAVSQLS